MTKQYGTRVDAPIVAGNDDTDDIASALGWQIKGNWQRFDTIADRDNWSKAFPSRVFNTTAFVLSDEDKRPNIYVWDGKSKDGSDGKWVETSTPGGIVVADVDGALVKRAKTLVLGEGFSLRDAGDQEGGVLLQYTPPDGSSISVSQSWGTKSNIKSVTEIQAQYPIEFIKGKDGVASITVKQGIYENAKSPDWLGYIKSNHTIAGKSTPKSAEVHAAGMLAFKNVVVDGGGVYLRMDSAGQEFTLQQTNESDPNVSGGSDFLISFRASLDGKALTDGSVLMYLYDSSINPFDKDSYLVDKNGDPLVAARHYKQGETLGDLDIAGIVNAKGLKSFTCHVVTNMTGFIELNDRFHGGTCLLVQDLSGKDKTGDALIQFELDTNDKLWYDSDGTTYNMKSSIPSGVVLGTFAQKYEAFIQDTQGNAALRYTVNSGNTPMPCGIAKKGHADVEVDPSVNVISGSSASGGEGAIKFLADGNVDISTTVRLNNENDHGSIVTFWWSTVGDDGSLTKIAESEKTITVFAKASNQETTLPMFNMLVESGDRIAFTAKSDYDDGVFLQTNSDRYPLLETIITFKEIQQAGEYENI